MNTSPMLFDFADSKPRKGHTPAERARTEAIIEQAAEDSYLIKEWRRWRAKEVTIALAGPHGADLAGLIAELKASPWDAIHSSAILAQWQGDDSDERGIRGLVRRVVNAFIADKREKAGLPPFSDPIPRFEGDEL